MSNKTFLSAFLVEAITENINRLDRNIKKFEDEMKDAPAALCIERKMYLQGLLKKKKITFDNLSIQ